MSRVLVLGGTGAMGVYLVERLIDMGHDVFVTSRTRKASTGRCTYLQGNAHDKAFLMACLSVKPDAIVDFMSYGTAEFRDRVEVLTSSTTHYLFLSSYRTFADDQPLKETSPRLLEWSHDAHYLATDEYALTKARQEDLLQARKTAWTIVRPGITYSKMRFQFGCLEANTVCWRSLRGLPLVMPKEMLEKRCTLTWGKDVAEMIARLVLNPKSYREIFIVASSESHTWEEVFKIYERELGSQLQSCSLEEYIEIIGNPYQVKYDRMFNREIDNSKILSVTGLSQSELMPLEQGLTSELEAFKRSPSYQYPIVSINAKIDRVCRTRAPLGGFSFQEKVYYWKIRYPRLGQHVIVRIVGKICRKLFHDRK